MTDSSKPKPEGLVSVVIVNFNGGPQLADNLDHLLDQDLVREVIVVDNHSSDDSMEQAERRHGDSARLMLYRNPVNAGFSAANNIGLKLASSDFCLILNPDCLLPPESLWRLLAVLESAPAAGMAGPLILNADGSEQRGCRRQLPRFASAFRRVLFGRRGAKRGFDLVGQPLPDNPVAVEAISGACMLVRRAAVDAVGLLDTAYFLHCEDLDWCRRFGEAGWQIFFVPDALAQHAQGVSSSSRPVRVLWYKHRSMWRYHAKFDALTSAAWLNGLVFVGIHLRALILTLPVFLRLSKP